MTIQTQLRFKPCLMRGDSCSSAEIKKSLIVPKKTTRESPEINANESQRRRVQFNEQVVVRTTEHINDFSEEEIINTWYQKAEYKMMRAAFAVTVRKVVNGEYKGDDGNHCARGLEFRSPSGAQRRKMKKLDCLVAVLDEQERQYCDNEDDPEALAHVYVQANHVSRHEAAQRGELDAEESARLCDGKESLTTLMFSGNARNSLNARPTKGIRSMFKRIQRK